VVAVIHHDELTRLLDPAAEVDGGEHVVAVAPAHRRREILRAMRRLGSEGAE
jgi:hypothetical protein